MSDDLPKTVRQDREGLIDRLDAIFALNREARARLAREKPEGWEEEFYSLNDDTMRRVDEAMKEGMLDDFPHLFRKREQRKKDPDELDGSKPGPGDYRKIEAGRTKEFIVFLFRWGPKSEHDGEGAETPWHEHLASSCALTPYFPGGSKNREKYATVLEMVRGADGEPDLKVSSPEPDKLSTVGGRKQYDDHVVFNGHPTKPAYTVHVYPIEIIKGGEVVSLSDLPLPPTAPNARSVPGYIDPATHRRDYGVTEDGTPLSKADVALARRGPNPDTPQR